MIVYRCDVGDGIQPAASGEHESVAFLDPETLRPAELADVYRRRAIEAQINRL